MNKFELPPNRPEFFIYNNDILPMPIQHTYKYRCFYIEHTVSSSWTREKVNEQFEELQKSGWDVVGIDIRDDGYLIFARAILTKENKDE